MNVLVYVFNSCQVDLYQADVLFGTSCEAKYKYMYIPHSLCLGVGAEQLHVS